MTAPQAYIALSLVILAAIALTWALLGKAGQRRRLTPLGGLAFALVVAGIVFGGDRPVGYSLTGLGVLLAVADAVRRARDR